MTARLVFDVLAAVALIVAAILLMEHVDWMPTGYQMRQR